MARNPILEVKDLDKVKCRLLKLAKDDGVSDAWDALREARDFPDEPEELFYSKGSMEEKVNLLGRKLLDFEKWVKGIGLALGVIALLWWVRSLFRSFW